MAKISVTRGLAMAKSLTAQIDAASMAPFVGVSVGKGTHQRALTLNATVAAAAASFQGNYDRVRALIKQRQSIKAAIVVSNATTKITLNGVEITVAEAIEMKASVDQKRALMTNLQNQSLKAGGVMTQQNAAMTAAIDKILESAAGGDKSKMDSAGAEQITKLQSDMKEAALIDPINISAAIETLKKEIDAVDLELDFTLSEVNAKTEIEVDLAA